MAHSSSIFHRKLGHTYPTATGGQGVYVHTSDGKKVLDGSCGAAVSCLGHGHPAVIAAIVDQAQALAFAHTSFFTNGPAEKLSTLLLSLSDDAFSKVMFVSSGSEAVEAALKIARQYHVSNGQPGRVNYVGRMFGYHGNTFGALSAGNNPQRRATFEPVLSKAFHHVSPCFFSRDAQPGESEQGYVDRLIAEYEDLFQSLGPETVAAVILEPISGATLGCVPPTAGYLSRIKELCARHGALLIFDEVMCGMGRAETTHAWQALGGTRPHIQTIGKGLGGGYQPISAVLVASEVHDVIEAAQVSLPFVNGHTYQGHPIGCAAALAVQQTIVDEKLLDNVTKMGELLVRRILEMTPQVKEVRGVGLFQAAEFRPAETTTTTAGTTTTSKLAAKVAAKCLENGAAVYLCSTAVDAVMFAPPFIISEAEVDELVAIFSSSVTQVLAEL
ncbi:pyridoxal phosphate-dependent transferase [Microdochium trichocladiopsis]|uniref:Pyridoxal phosphate-dependent transferase n=1 Tax=Microdochium trichocladiopsis TaxID=1682393 RepID=A0A9P8XY91_9PEZI|nr:pyridoxal phosphate-dependent transferase [Microdochium trichocladiopsis]KAH7024770.1 pyridoxal phosphate-dependent transferase [Microdochium trichocladiopsis]